ncbi:MAG TPA: PTS sugar transporter subunit IIB [Defluviitaleaceae bacterium]|jgi:mannose/fructose/N-acetylgalactosamine-specific phosphotransferase system component IIB|nr:PTS sugar transporter subunit IIB [Candidatus Epulonipiscium sp.]HOQ16786.1 PTS sugar transporter subunit IIB [Defluviitaleaceae bacterium]HPT75632.1 PTS sugar transporter subunit IIB [Defluviitaleaceae bacterium]HQD50571.1 PTS sugar transporter subunit IIB [Defluviitaleaceae bacterium]
MGKTYIRVDDRLIHGQTIVAWCPALSIKEIIAIDDESAKNPMLKSILTMGVPQNYKTHIVTTEEAKKLLKEESPINRLVIVRFPEKLEELKEEMEQVEMLILGNIAKRPDTVHKVSGATGIFYLSDRDVSIIDEIASKGIEVCFQQVPTTSKTTWEAFKKSIN